MGGHFGSNFVVGGRFPTYPAMGKGAEARGQRQGSKGQGPGSRGQGPEARGQGPEARDQGPGKRDKRTEAIDWHMAGLRIEAETPNSELILGIFGHFAQILHFSITVSA